MTNKSPTPSFNNFPLTLINPSFDSPLVDALTELEYLRRLHLHGDTPRAIFFELKAIFHHLESLASARIEGNHTTLADFIDSQFDRNPAPNESLREIQNIEEVLTLIDAQVQARTDLTEVMIRTWHALTVSNLRREGDISPGAYRQNPVRIAQSTHLPPEPFMVPIFMQELIAFINRDDAPKYALIKIATAHHRFAWIHPFGNGNGRVVRLLTYAMLLKYGFNVQQSGRLLNPTAVFCNDRQRYYDMLACADASDDKAQEEWCLYVLSGILEELKKMEKLTKMEYLLKHILIPALTYAKQRQLMTDLEEKILQKAIQQDTVKAGDFKSAMPSMSEAQRSYQIKKLVERKMLKPLASGARLYTIGLTNSYLLRGVIHTLTQEGFIPNGLLTPPSR